jgi:hypothetical protein
MQIHLPESTVYLLPGTFWGCLSGPADGENADGGSVPVPFPVPFPFPIIGFFYPASASGPAYQSTDVLIADLIIPIIINITIAIVVTSVIVPVIVAATIIDVVGLSRQSQHRQRALRSAEHDITNEIRA